MNVSVTSITFSDVNAKFRSEIVCPEQLWDGANDSEGDHGISTDGIICFRLSGEEQDNREMNRTIGSHR